MASVHPAPAPRHRHCTPHNRPCDDLRGILSNPGEATNTDTASDEELLGGPHRLAPLGLGQTPLMLSKLKVPYISQVFFVTVTDFFFLCITDILHTMI